MKKGFTLIETLLAVALFALVAGAVYAVCAAAMEATAASTQEAADQERLETFLRATRNSFLELPGDAAITLRPDPSGSGPPDMVFSVSGTYFGLGDLAGGELVLSARARADGTRAFALRKVAAEDLPLAGASPDGDWLVLLPGVENPRWEFFFDNEWVSEWGGGRPLLVKLTFQQADRGGLPVEAIFWIPPLNANTRAVQGNLIEEPPPQNEAVSE
jgi:prepilin-type N-terminal cleavage/methylation domain-containing protein